MLEEGHLRRTATVLVSACGLRPLALASDTWQLTSPFQSLRFVLKLHLRESDAECTMRTGSAYDYGNTFHCFVGRAAREQTTRPTIEPLRSMASRFSIVKPARRTARKFYCFTACPHPRACSSRCLIASPIGTT